MGCVRVRVSGEKSKARKVEITAGTTLQILKENIVRELELDSRVDAGNVRLSLNKKVSALPLHALAQLHTVYFVAGMVLEGAGGRDDRI